jgi:hypothetical protein
MQGSFFPSSVQTSAGETAARFSELSKRNDIAGVVDALREEFPFITDLSLELVSGTAMIYAFIPPMPEKLPLTLVSGGIHKFFNLLLAIANSRQGIVLVDEIENEFYYDRMTHVWSAVLDFCQRYDSQLFASTHSLECLQAAAHVAERNSDEFCLLRPVRDDTRCIVRYFTGRDFQEAVKDDIEGR